MCGELKVASTSTHNMPTEKHKVDKDGIFSKALRTCTKYIKNMEVNNGYHCRHAGSACSESQEGGAKVLLDECVSKNALTLQQLFVSLGYLQTRHSTIAL